MCLSFFPYAKPASPVLCLQMDLRICLAFLDPVCLFSSETPSNSGWTPPLLRQEAADTHCELFICCLSLREPPTAYCSMSEYFCFIFLPDFSGCFKVVNLVLGRTSQMLYVYKILNSNYHGSLFLLSSPSNIPVNLGEFWCLLYFTMLLFICISICFIMSIRHFQYLKSLE